MLVENSLGDIKLRRKVFFLLYWAFMGVNSFVKTGNDKYAIWAKCNVQFGSNDCDSYLALCLLILSLLV